MAEELHGCAAEDQATLLAATRPDTHNIHTKRDGSASWGTAVAGGSGTITFTTLTLLRAIGTFAFSGAPVPGTSATGTKMVMSGAFDVSFGVQ